MAIRALVWGENVHEQTNEVVRAIYPDGMHATIAAALNEDKGIKATTATLQEPEHGLTEARLAETDVLLWWGHAAHGKVEDEIVERVAEARLGRHGADRAALRPFLEDLHAADGHAVLAEMARGGRARAHLGDQPQPSDRRRGSANASRSPNDEMYGEPFAVPEPLETVFISWFEGGEVFRSGLTYQRGAGRIFYFAPGHETYPIYHHADVRTVLRNAVHWAHNPARPWTAIIDAPNVPVDKAKEPMVQKGAEAARRRRSRAALERMPKLLLLGTGGIAGHHIAEFAAIPECRIVACVDARSRPRRGLCRGERHRPRLRRPRRGARLGRVRRGDQLHARRRPHGDDAGAARRRQARLLRKAAGAELSRGLAMTEAAEAAGLVNMVNLTYRNVAGAAEGARAWSRPASIGALRHVEASYLQSWLVGKAWGDWRAEDKWLWRLSTKHGSTGVLGDVGIHILDFATYGAADDIVRVQGRSRDLPQGRGRPHRRI